MITKINELDIEPSDKAQRLAHMKIVTEEELAEQCSKKCPFLYQKYNDLFQRILRDELDLEMLFQLLNTLKDIEDGDIDQEKGSVRVGKLLYNMFVDSINRKTAKEDESKTTTTVVAENMSWSDYKKMKKTT